MTRAIAPARMARFVKTDIAPAVATRGDVPDGPPVPPVGEGSAGKLPPAP